MPGSVSEDASCPGMRGCNDKKPRKLEYVGPVNGMCERELADSSWLGLTRGLGFLCMISSVTRPHGRYTTERFSAAADKRMVRTVREERIVSMAIVCAIKKQPYLRLNFASGSEETPDVER